MISTWKPAKTLCKCQNLLGKIGGGLVLIRGFEKISDTRVFQIILVIKPENDFRNSNHYLLYNPNIHYTLLAGVLAKIAYLLQTFYFQIIFSFHEHKNHK
jgi:hypothetical protein